MKPFKKVIALAMGCTLSVVGFAGCGEGRGPGGTGQPSDIVIDVDPNVTAAISLGYKNENNEPKIAQNLADSFKAKFPNVTVELVAFSDATTTTSIDKLYRSGAMPDIFLTNSFDMLSIDAKYEDLLLDLNPYIELEEEAGTFSRSDYYTTWWKLGQRDFNGAQLMVPRAADRVVVHYNKEKIEEAEAKTGKEILKYIKNGWTWDDFNTVCDILVESNLAKYIVDSNMDWEAVYNPILTHFGVEYFDENGDLAVDSPEAEEAVAFFRNWVDKKYVAPGNGEAADFDNGKGFMHFQSRALSTTLDILRTKAWPSAPAGTQWWEKYDVVTMPVFEDDPRIGVGAAGYCASTTAENPDIVWQFMKHIASKEGQNAIAGVANYVPIRKDMADFTDPANQWGVGYENFNLAAFTYMSGNTDAEGNQEEDWNCYTDYFLKKSSKYAVALNDAFGDYLVEAYAYGSQYSRTFEDVIRSLTTRVEQVLRK